MCIPAPFFVQDVMYRHDQPAPPDVTPGNGRAPLIQGINAPIWPVKPAPVAKNGTLRLDQGAYILPQNDLPGMTHLHLNENLFAAAKAAIDKGQLAELLDTHLATLHSYPTGGVKALQATIATGLQIAPEKVVIAPGSAALLRDLVVYLLKAHETLLLPAPTWNFYYSLVNLVAAKIETFPLLQEGQAFVYDKRVIAANIEACAPKVVLICSPNNPTGNVLPLADFLWLVREYPQVDFVLDEAYYGFHESYSADQEKELLASTDQSNVFVIRTFSKFYGLANLRLGFLLCSAANGRNLQNLAPAFGLPSLNQALAAQRFADKQYRVAMRQEYAAVNAYMFAALKQVPGFIPYKTFANFILVQHDDQWADVDEALLDHGYKVKRETINGARNYLRITYADMATMQAFVKVLWQLAPQEMVA